MSAKEYRQIAKSKLKGYWRKFALLSLVQALITIGITGSIIMGFVAFLVLGPLEFGYVGILLNFSRGKDFKVANLLDGFDYFRPAFILRLLCDLFTILWSLLLIVPGIIASYSYSMSFYILRDDPRIKPNDARNLSIAMMRGHKWKLFCLHLSFIGWILLSLLTLGILFLWVMPYINLATAEFYENLKNNK